MNIRIFIYLRSLKDPVEDYYPDIDAAKAAIAKIQKDVTGAGGLGAVTTPSGLVTFETKDFVAAKIG